MIKNKTEITLLPTRWLDVNKHQLDKQLDFLQQSDTLSIIIN